MSLYTKFHCSRLPRRWLKVYSVFTISNKSQVFGKSAIPQFLSKTHILKITNNYKLTIPTISLVSETEHMFVFQFFAAKIAIPPVPLLTETAL